MTDELLQAYLKTLKMDLNFFRDSLKEVSKEIIDGGYSKYPIFVAHQAEVKLGEVILDREEIGSNFTIQASTLEEMEERKVILTENASVFKSAFKDPAQFCCIFLVTEHGARFVFVPFDPPPPETDTQETE